MVLPIHDITIFQDRPATVLIYMDISRMYTEEKETEKKSKRKRSLASRTYRFKRGVFFPMPLKLGLQTGEDVSSAHLPKLEAAWATRTNGKAVYPFATRTKVLFSFSPSIIAPRPAMFWR